MRLYERLMYFVAEVCIGFRLIFRQILIKVTKFIQKMRKFKLNRKTPGRLLLEK